MPSTQTFPLDPLDPELLDELLELLEPPEELLLLDELLEPSSPQNALRDRAHATSEPAQTPSTQAAARYDPPLAQLQHDGLQSA